MERQSAARGDFGRWLSVLLRCAHLLAVVWLGAALAGAPLDRGGAAASVLASGALLLALDLAGGRIRLDELAGGAVLLKLLAAGWVAWQPAHAVALFWALVALSALTSHATKRVRHWPRSMGGSDR